MCSADGLDVNRAMHYGADWPPANTLPFIIVITFMFLSFLDLFLYFFCIFGIFHT